jgi:hypothetical protein
VLGRASSEPDRHLSSDSGKFVEPDDHAIPQVNNIGGRDLGFNEADQLRNIHRPGV